MHRSGWGVAVLVVSVGTACYSPTPADCAITCGAGGACPDGTSCTDGFCRPAGATEDCAGQLDGAPDALGSADGTPADATVPIDAGPDACLLATISVPAIDDTSLVPSNPDLNFGTQPIINVGVGVNAPALFRFSIPAFPATATPTAVRLTFHYAPTSTACAAPCGSCASIESPGTLSLFYMRNDWSENAATWNQRVSGSGWAAAGASLAGVDRSALPIATAPHIALTDQVMTVAAGDLAALNTSWRQADEISFQLLASSGAVFIAATSESPLEMCTPDGYPPPELQIDYCPSN